MQQYQILTPQELSFNNKHWLFVLHRKENLCDIYCCWRVETLLHWKATLLIIMTRIHMMWIIWSSWLRWTIALSCCLRALAGAELQVTVHASDGNTPLEREQAPAGIQRQPQMLCVVSEANPTSAWKGWGKTALSTERACSNFLADEIPRALQDVLGSYIMHTALLPAACLIHQELLWGKGGRRVSKFLIRVTSVNAAAKSVRFGSRAPPSIQIYSPRYCHYRMRGQQRQ